MDKKEIKERENKLLELTGIFCSQKLDDDYFQLCEKLIKKMGRKREVPFKRGKLEIWVAAVIYTIGSINFLFDKSFEPYMTAQQISDYFGTKNSTVSNKARQIREMFDLTMFDNEFATEHMNETNPFNDLVMVDGLIVPLSSIPENLQELVRKERAEGRDIEFTTEKE
ncbi:MAG: DUF6398 domain-containing protein [Flavobacteriaceae bacterium]|nr:DUF6398 domain-containing protein [Flavobacteriaceae bacterium]